MTLTQRKSQRGYLLLELVTAMTLFCIAGLALYAGFVQGVRCYHRIELSQKNFNASKLFFLRLEEDARNMVVLRDHPFEGKADEIRFPALLPGAAKNGETVFRLAEVHYYLKGKTLIREEEELSTRLSKPRPKEKVLLTDGSEVSFRFPYEGEEGAHEFESFWLDDPYRGLPRAIQVEVKKEDFEWVKTISIPPGFFGTPNTQAHS